MSPTANPSFRTRAASDYLIERGVQASQSYLQKVRVRGIDDARDHGPDFVRDEHGFCWYTRDALDRYIMQRMKSRQFRGDGTQPANFRKDR